MKERVTLTLDQGLLHAIDSRVDGTQIKNRSHAVELFLRQAITADSPGTAVIMAGGKGARLAPLTDTLPKALIEVRGKPVLLWNIELCKRHGITEIIVCIGHLGDKIVHYFAEHPIEGVNLTFIKEDSPLGTAGPLRGLKDRLNGTFVLMNGDELKDVHIPNLYQAHIAYGGMATIALTTVDDPSAYGVALMDGNRIVRFVEKPKKDDAPSRLISAGLYILEPKAIDLVPKGFAMIEYDVFPKIAKEGGLHGYPFSGQWIPVNTLQRLKDAQKDWKGFSA